MPKEPYGYFKEHESFIGIPFQEGEIAHLYEKFIQLKDLLARMKQ